MLRRPGDPNDFVQRVQKDTQQYVEELLRENERLRTELSQLEADRERLSDAHAALQQQLQLFEAEQLRLAERLSAVETDNDRFASEYSAVEQQIANLANLYVATHRLSGTTDPAEILIAIDEIIINLIGSEELAIFFAQGDELRFAHGFGLDEADLARHPAWVQQVRACVAAGQQYIADKRSTDQRAAFAIPAGCERVTAVIPVRIGPKTIGAILILALLPHKPALLPIDLELLDLLGSHAGMPLYIAQQAE